MTSLRLIKEMQKNWKAEQAEEKAVKETVKQDKLIVSTGKGFPGLQDLHVRGNLLGKKLSGNLAAHVNGFRYTSIRGDKIDVLYNNIKHAIFQV